MTRRALWSAKRSASFRPVEGQPVRRHVQIERPLQQEILLRLRALKPRCIYFPVPNGVFIPARTEAEKLLAKRIVSQMKQAGQLIPGAFDLVFLWENNGGAGIEIKPGPTRTLLGTTPRGRLSANQRTFRDWCLEMGVEYRVCEDWAGVLAALKAWGRISER